jgi:hypothetical protein
MEGDSTGVRKFLSILGILLIVGAAYLNLLGIMEANTTNNKDLLLPFVISANIINGLAVICLVILTINSTSLSTLFKTFFIIILLAGLVGEYYLFSTELYSKNYINYIVLISNLLIRTYYLTYYFNQAWAMFPGSPTAVIKVIEKAVSPTEGVKVNELTDSEIDNFKKRWRAIFQQARSKVGAENFDESSVNSGWNEIINPAIAAKDYSMDRLKDASKYLKDKAGNQITDLVFGGKKRR